MKRQALRASVSVLAFAVLLVAVAAVSAPYAPVQKGFQPAGNDVLPYAPDRIIVKFKESSMQRSTLKIPRQVGSVAPGIVTGLSSVDALNQQIRVVQISRPFIEPANAAAATQFGFDRAFMLHVPDGTDIAAAVNLYAADPNVEYATPDWLAFPAVVPTDPAYAQHWGHNNTVQLPGLDWGGTYDHTLPTTVGVAGFDANAQLGWDGTAGFGDPNVIIAIIDSGVNLSHPDLTLVAGWDYGSGDSNPEDNSSSPGHGTACAGVAAAEANNGIGA